MTEGFTAGLRRGDVLLGAVVALPGDDVLGVAASAGLDFLVVDLVDGPRDDVALRRLSRSAHWAGLGVVILAGPELQDEPWRSSADAVVAHRDGRIRLGPDDEGVPLAVVGDAGEARSRVAAGVQLIALDVGAALAAMLTSFATTATAPADPEPLVLLPGMLGDARVFDGVIAALPPDVPCRPMRIDLDDSVAELAESVLAAAPDRFALAGHSLGGIVALEVWRRAPARVTRLALLNSSARPPSEAQLAAWAELGECTEAGGFAAVVAEQAQANVGPSGGQALVDVWTDMAEKVGPEGFLRQLRAQASRPDSRPSLAAIAVPTLVVTGGDDTVCPAALQGELAAGIPDARHVSIDGAGHMSPLDHPAEVATHLATWLRA